MRDVFRKLDIIAELHRDDADLPGLLIKTVDEHNLVAGGKHDTFRTICEWGASRARGRREYMIHTISLFVVLSTLIVLSVVNHA
jgi:hypothetical protein